MNLSDDTLPNVAICECSIDQSCGDIFGTEQLCNCDSNDDVIRNDSGFLRYKPDLPVTRFCAGDTGSFIGYVTLGLLFAVFC